MKFKVYVEKRMYACGEIEIEAANEDEAVEMVERKIAKGDIQTTAVKWGDLVYEDCSFATTGDVEEGY